MDQAKTAKLSGATISSNEKKAGLNVKFLGGRPMEFNRWVAAVKSSDPKIDVLEGSWDAAGDPSPSVFYGEKIPYNFDRFVSPTNTKLLEIGRAHV